MSSRSPSTNKYQNAIRTILFAGLIAGFLDGAAAVINYLISTNGKNPVRIFNFIASGVFGKKAFTGGWAMAGWGLLLHFIIACLFAAFFYFLYPRIKFLSKNIIITGIVYGIFVWLVMNLAVVPLSSTPPLPFTISKAITAVLILIFCVGIPIALVVHKSYPKPVAGNI